MTKKIKLSPKTYRQFGYDGYQIIDGKIYYWLTNEDGDDEFYDAKGKWHSVMN